ncbi:MAG: NTP/NDP exchange transporter [Holosporaceae bacterium]|jgi:AAA family ATP:ADP antiporter|nr:NTP/NDP exchange transporter [Holosporaceae bacterium]
MGDDKKTEKTELTGLRSMIWPIHGFELKKFLPMAIMMMCILFNYSILRGMKDSLVVTSMGAETIPTLKLWFVLPSAVLFMIIYSKISNMFSKDSVFYIVVAFFVGYFLLFATLLYPYHQHLHTDFPNITIKYISRLLKPVGCWTFSSFYVMAELWGSSMVSLMFWRFANDVTSLKESKRFYSMFGFVANGALIISGTFLKEVKGGGGSGADQWGALPYLIGTVIVSCFVIIGLYYWLNNCVLKDPRYYNPDEIKKTKKKEKLSLGDSMKYIFRSPYLGYIVLLVVCYGVSINLVEVMWKDQAKLLYPTKNEFNAFMGGLQIYTGIATILFMLIGANILRKCSWFVGAMITPITFFVTGLIFFAFIIFRPQLEPIVASIGGITVLGVINSVGLIQNVLAKGVKYSLFDPTKEMSYIPLDDELKSKGKAAVDVIGSRAGKSGGALIQFVLLNVIFVGSALVELSSIIAVIFSVILLLWFVAVRGLNKKFLEITADHAS